MIGERHRVVVIGASVAGVTAAETLRQRGFQGSITLIGDETHLPYDRPPLSKQVLAGTWDAGRIALRDHAAFERLRVNLRLGSRARALDTEKRIVTLDDGGSVPYDRLIVATGVIPRRLAAGHDLDGVHVLRTVDDALAIRKRLHPGRRLVVVGAGFLGCEVAASARKAGLEVSIVDPGPAPMIRQVGELVGGRVAALHREHGVEVRCGVAVRRLMGDRAVTGVELVTGEILDADLVLVAIGSVPATDWLVGSGLSVDNGVVCDSTCQAAPGVYAAGDVARWWHKAVGAYVRVEHRTNAAEQAIAVASNLLGANTPFTPVPYFWTDQYETRLQGYGIFPPDSSPVITGGDPSGGRFIAHYLQDGRVTGVLAWNMPREFRTERECVGRPIERFAESGV